jgi:hypothetical protein
MSAAVVTSPTTNPIIPHFLSNGMFPDGDSFTSCKSSHISNSNMSPMLSHEAELPIFDPILYGDDEIPWAPSNRSQETESHGADITPEEFFCFIEQNPSIAHPSIPSFSTLIFL